MCCEKYYEFYPFFYIMLDGICSLYVSKNTVLKYKKRVLLFANKTTNILSFSFCFVLIYEFCSVLAAFIP